MSQLHEQVSLLNREGLIQSSDLTFRQVHSHSSCSSSTTFLNWIKYHISFLTVKFCRYKISGWFKRSKIFKRWKFLSPTLNSCYLGQKHFRNLKIVYICWYLDITICVQILVHNAPVWNTPIGKIPFFFQIFVAKL